jgi:protein phosphatase-4 regulatory subunit 3
MNGVASQHSQPQSLLNTSTISGPAGTADHISGAGSTSTSNQQALQHSPHHDSTSPNDTSNNPSPSDLEPLTTTAGETEALAPKEQPPGDKIGEEQEPVFIKEEGEVLHGTVNGQIELLEHTPEPNVGSSDAEVMVNDSDAQDWIPDADHELKRVKVCQP